MSYQDKPDLSRRNALKLTAAAAALGGMAGTASLSARAATTDGPETTKAVLGFIALTDAAPLIIAKEKCTLYAKSLKQLKGRAFTIDQDKCKNHRDCINTIACPAFYLDGDRVMINADLCVGCSICAQICPEKAIRPVKSKNE